jgi:hypothetical protein
VAAGSPRQNGAAAIGAARAEIEREERLFAKGRRMRRKKSTREPCFPGFSVSDEEWHQGGQADRNAPGHENREK